jgi:hypothetical protein
MESDHVSAGSRILLMMSYKIGGRTLFIYTPSSSYTPFIYQMILWPVSCERDAFAKGKKIAFSKEKNGAAWLERSGDFPLKGRKFPLT